MSRVSWQTREDHIRHAAQTGVQRLFAEEATEARGRLKSQRRAAVDGPAGARNGSGKPRALALSHGTITVRRLRGRGRSERCASRILPWFKRHTERVGDLLPELDRHGLSSGDFALALRGWRGEAAPLSASALDRRGAVWQAEYEAWKRRPLHEVEVVSLGVDGISVQAGLEKDQAAVRGAAAGLRDGRTVVLAVAAGPRESTEAWSASLRDLTGRGRNGPRLVLGAGHLGMGGRGPRSPPTPRSSAAGTTGSSTCWTSCPRRTKPPPTRC